MFKGLQEEPSAFTFDVTGTEVRKHSLTAKDDESKLECKLIKHNFFHISLVYQVN